MEDFQFVAFLVSILSVMFFMGNFYKMERSIDEYRNGSITLEELKDGKKMFVMSGLFSILLVSISGMLFLVGF